MFIFLSPAKSLDFKTPPHVATHTQPAYLKHSEALIKKLRKLSPADISNLMDLDDLDFAQSQVRILSGLYGILKPLDLMQPYRLEMGTKFANKAGKDLYAFWGERLLKAINAELADMPRPVAVNLASEEYFKAAVGRKINGTVIQPVFEDWKNGQYKIISFYAKRARGLMTRYAVMNRLTEPEALKHFDYDGYAFVAAVSDDTRWVFRRRQ